MGNENFKNGVFGLHEKTEFLGSLGKNQIAVFGLKMSFPSP